MNGSFSAVGRPDVSQRMEHDLSTVGEHAAVQATGRDTGVVDDVKEHMGGIVPTIGQYVSMSQDGITAQQQRLGYDLGRG